MSASAIADSRLDVGAAWWWPLLLLELVALLILRLWLLDIFVSNNNMISIELNWIDWKVCSACQNQRMKMTMKKASASILSDPNPPNSNWLLIPTWIDPHLWREHVTRRGRFGGNMVTQPSLAFDRLRSLSPLARAPLAAGHRRPPWPWPCISTHTYHLHPRYLFWELTIQHRNSNNAIGARNHPSICMPSPRLCGSKCHVRGCVSVCR